MSRARARPDPVAATVPEDSIRLGSLVVDREGVVQHVSARAPAVLGRSAASLVGAAVRDVLALGEPCVAELQQLLAGRRQEASFLFVAQGSEARHRALAEPLPGGPGGRFLIHLVRSDEYLAQAHARAQVELRTTIESIIGGFAHEVRNPLASILSLTEVALEDWAEHHERPTELARVPQLVSRIESLLRQSIAYSRPPRPQLGFHQLGHLVEQTERLLRPSTTEKLAVVGAGEETFFADADQVGQVLINLLENAADAADSSVVLRSRAGILDGAAMLILDVEDDGPGVKPDLRKRIFEPFFTTKAHGTGLGLAIARDLARMNGGNLTLTSADPRRTIFTLTVPTHHRKD